MVEELVAGIRDYGAVHKMAQARAQIEQVLDGDE